MMKFRDEPFKGCIHFLKKRESLRVTGKITSNIISSFEKYKVGSKFQKKCYSNGGGISDK